MILFPGSGLLLLLGALAVLAMAPVSALCAGILELLFYFGVI